MADFPSQHDLEALQAMLGRERAVPGDPAAERLVYWHHFRRRDAALRFACGIQLGDEDDLVGGCTRDSLGTVYWIGVQVADLDAWGNRGAIGKTDGVDPENPDSPML